MNLPEVIYQCGEASAEKYYFLGMTKHSIGYAIYVNERTAEPIRVYINEGKIQGSYFTDESKALQHVLEGAELRLTHINAEIERSKNVLCTCSNS